MARVDLDWHGDEAIFAADSGAEEGLEAAAEHLLGASRALVPLEEAVLERSGRASQAGLRAAVSYDTVYAARQHEELTWRHDPGRQAKYLEAPLHTDAGERNDIIAAHIRRRLT